MLTMFVPSSGAFVLEPRPLPVADAEPCQVDEAASDTACCMICGCPAGPAPSRWRNVAQNGRRAARWSCGVRPYPMECRGVRPEPLSIAMACLLLVGGFIYLAV